MGLALNGHWLGSSKNNGNYVNVHPLRIGRTVQSGHNFGCCLFGVTVYPLPWGPINCPLSTKDTTPMHYMSSVLSIHQFTHGETCRKGQLKPCVHEFWLWLYVQRDWGENRNEWYAEEFQLYGTWYVNGDPSSTETQSVEDDEKNCWAKCFNV